MKSCEQQNKSVAENKVSRRAFLKVGGAGVAALSCVQVASAKDESGKRLGMVIDLQRCTGCGGCIIACKSENNVQRGNAWASMIVETSGKFPNVKYGFVPTLCNHCEKAPCIKACPTKPKTMHKGYGNITMHNPKTCIGCKRCIAKCPFGVISYNKKETHKDWRSDEELIKGCTPSAKEVTEKVNGNVIPYYNEARERSTEGSGLRRKRIVEKCTLCDHRVKYGLLPHCVSSCPANARIFGDLNDPNSEPSKLLVKHKAWRLKEEKGTEPKVFYIREFNPSANKGTKGSV